MTASIAGVAAAARLISVFSKKKKKKQCSWNIYCCCWDIIIPSHLTSCVSVCVFADTIASESICLNCNCLVD